jgi:hypothetical protein
MFSSASEPGDAAREPSSELPREAPGEGTRRDGELFDRVLAETRSLLDGGAVPSGAEMEALRAVARHHRGCELVVDPVLTELVQSVLEHRFPRDWRHDALWADVSRRIAETLAEDAPSWQRLSVFWSRLCEAT